MSRSRIITTARVRAPIALHADQVSKIERPDEMDCQLTIIPWEDNSTVSSIHELDHSIWMDCIPGNEDIGDFLVDCPTSNNEDDDNDDDSLDLVTEDSLVVDMVPMDFLSAPEEEEEDERPMTPRPSTLSDIPYFPAEEDDVFLSPSTSIVSSCSQDSDDEYLIGILRLRASMRRSEATRQHIRSQMFLRPSALVTKSFPNSMDFFTGSRSTLTTGLEHSRQMLMTFLQPMDSL